jgi:acetoin utilization deacetylase AcuC-like enzyme
MAMAPARGRLLAVLEGGYHVGALARCVSATITTMAGAPISLEAPTSGGPGRDVVAAIAARRR